tara:strand:- start:1753 stop:2580 length:828 start_codon:yes stop_codon:yes gene_type:complete
MKLTLLGTGCPSIDYKRCGSSNLVSSKKTKILVDCGSGVTQRLNQSGNSSADIDALLLTHLHTDHVVDLYQLIISSWHSDRNSIWKIYGPKGTKRFIDKIFLAWKSERYLRVAYEKRKSIKALKYKVYEFNKEGNISINDLKIKYFEVDHKPVPFAYGFSFFNNKKKLTISGDTRPCENLMINAQNADVLLHEVLIEYELNKTSMLRTKKTLHNVKKYHTTSDLVGKVAKLSNCKKLVLTHFVPTRFNISKLKKIIRRDFGKDPIIGEDLLTIKI